MCIRDRCESSKVEEAKKEAEKISEWIIDIRRELHKHPELMYEEIKTSALVRRELDKLGILKKYNVELIGARAESIEKAENRLKFREAMDKIGIESPKSQLVSNITNARDALEEIGLPMIIRPSFTLGGSGGGVAFNNEEYEQIVLDGIAASPVGEVLVEESVLGWKEYEMEVIRDNADNCIIVCSIENVDPMGVHTGDSITVAPALTLTDKEFQILRNCSIAVLREIGVDTGGSNVQFAINPKDGRLVIIETVSYTHLRAHETREDRGWRGLG